METPFPIEATIEVQENGHRASLSCVSEWLTEHETGNVLQRAVERVSYVHGENVEVPVTFYEDGSYDVGEPEDGEPEEAPEA